MNKNAICLCCDAAFFALAKGTVLSLQELFPANDVFDICFLDIGLEDQQRDWLIAHNVTVKRFDELKLFDSLPDYFQNYHKSLVVRPFLRKIFPGYDVYMMSDTDIWFQSAECVRTFIDYATEYAPKIVIVPTVDTSYRFNYSHYSQENYARFTDLIKLWYEASYNQKLAEEMHGRVLFSAGLFAMHRDSQIWGLWAKEFETIFNKDFTDKMWALHLSEQCALNKVIYETGDFMPLTASHNYNCHIGTLKRDDKSGRVVIDYPPFTEIGAVHLTYSSKFMIFYINNNLLYQGGAYLTETEWEQVRAINHFV